MKESNFIFAVGAVLAGCGDSNIDIVKNYTFAEAKMMTIGSAIDGFKDCKSVKWADESKDDLKVVTAVCDVKDEILKSEFDARNAKYNEAVKKADDEKQKSIIFALNTLNKSCKTLRNEAEFSLEEALSVANKFCKFDSKKSGFIKTQCDENGVKNELLNTYNVKDSGLYLNNCVFSFGVLAEASQREPNVFWMGEMPKQIASRTYKFSFFVNTDKSVSLKEIVRTDDDKTQKLSKMFLAKVYKRD